MPVETWVEAMSEAMVKRVREFGGRTEEHKGPETCTKNIFEELLTQGIGG